MIYLITMDTNSQILCHLATLYCFDTNLFQRQAKSIKG